MMVPPTTNTQSDTDSDSDWDQDDDFASRKISITIKPITQVTPSKISASVDELRATVETWKSMANVNLVKPNSRRHHRSTAQLNYLGRGNSSQGPPLPPLPQSSMGTSKSAVILPAVRSTGLNDYGRIESIMNNDLTNVTPTFDNGTPFSEFSAGPPVVHFDTQIIDGLGRQEILKSDFHRTNSAPNTIPTQPFRILEAQIPTTNGQLLSSEPINGLDHNKIPVAFAVQECLHAKFVIGHDQEVSSSIVGHIKIAVPPMINNVPEDHLKKHLELSVVSDIAWSSMELAENFVEEQICHEPPEGSSPVKILSINLEEVRKFTQNHLMTRHNLKYILLPELLKYTIRSRPTNQQQMLVGNSEPSVNPIHISSHWLCDLNMTKVRVDIAAIEESISTSRIQPSDIRSLKITMQVTGGVVSYQSKPEANWNAIDSKLTWSFGSLAELKDIAQSADGVCSCLARFELDDGPSIPGDISLQFMIAGKTISGTQIILIDTENFNLSRQKFEVRTGSFTCEAPAT